MFNRKLTIHASGRTLGHSKHVFRTLAEAFPSLKLDDRIENGFFLVEPRLRGRAMVNDGGDVVKLLLSPVGSHIQPLVEFCERQGWSLVDSRSGRALCQARTQQVAEQWLVAVMGWLGIVCPLLTAWGLYGTAFLGNTSIGPLRAFGEWTSVALVNAVAFLSGFCLLLIYPLLLIGPVSLLIHGVLDPINRKSEIAYGLLSAAAFALVFILLNTDPYRVMGKMFD